MWSLSEAKAVSDEWNISALSAYQTGLFEQFKRGLPLSLSIDIYSARVKEIQSEVLPDDKQWVVGVFEKRFLLPLVLDNLIQNGDIRLTERPDTRWLIVFNRSIHLGRRLVLWAGRTSPVWIDCEYLKEIKDVD